MIYKGFKDIQLSCLGMGNMRLPVIDDKPGAPIDYKRAQEIIDYAYEKGINYFDTAYVYHNGESETFLGEALKKYPRDSYYLATKFYYLANHDYKAVFEEQLKKLQTDYIDLMLIHQAGFFNLPEEAEKHRQECGDFFDYDIVPPNDPKYRLGYNVDCLKEAWGAMEKAVKEGKIRSIGISNFSTKKVNDLLSFCSIVPAMNQVELHPYLQQWETMEALDKHGIKLTAYFPLGGAMTMGSDVSPMKNPVILEIAKNHNKTAAQVLIRWAIQRGTVCIPKSVHENRIKENFDVFDFELTPEEMEKIKSLDKKQRFADPTGLLYPGVPDSKKHWDGEYI